MIIGENCILLGRNSPEEIIESLSEVMNNDDKRVALELNALELAKKHTYKQRAKTIIELWRNLEEKR